MPKIEVGVATEKEHMVLKGGEWGPAEWEKKLVPAPSQPSKFVFLPMHICQIA